VPLDQTLDFVRVKRGAHVCRLVADIGLQGFIVEADDEVPAVEVAKGKRAAYDF
jgi:hypothetical protein